MRGDGRVFQRGERWWISYYAPKNGKRVEIRESAGATEQEAEKLLKNRVREVHNHRDGIRSFFGPQQERVTVNKLLENLARHYEVKNRSSWGKLDSHLKHIRSYFGDDRALALTDQRLLDYAAMRQNEGVKPATINRELDGLQIAFRLAVKSKLVATSPNFPNLPENNAREGFFERADFEAVSRKLTVRGKLDPDLQDFCE